MNKQKGMKRIIVHVGPHKTGTTAIQKCLSKNAALLTTVNTTYFHTQDTHKAALHLARREFAEAKEAIERFSAQISDLRTDTVILSQEDFSGNLPGRTRRRTIYPDLTKNIRIIKRLLQPHRTSFVFFRRDEDSWLRSAYHQHLRYRTLFSNFAEFKEHFGADWSWQAKLDKLIENFGSDIVEIPYERSADAGIREILKLIGQPNLSLPNAPSRENSSLAVSKIPLFERINALSEFKETAWFSKKLIAEDWTPRPLEHANVAPSDADCTLADMALPALSQRAQHRIHSQQITDILPDIDVDLQPLLYSILPDDLTEVSVPRANIENQSRILNYHFRGKSEIAKLNALCISYLRRDTEHTPKARFLFHRIWREHGAVLINECSTRWLISTLQTFLDHGENEAQRMIGASGYIFANMMKIYEGERAIEGLPQDGTYKHDSPQTPNKFRGLDRFNVGGTDLLLNTNAISLGLAMQDDVAGLIMIELHLRAKASGSVFTRMDATRKERDIHTAGFTDTWSYFEPE
ncbi:MAG: hypothetical protein ACPGVN_00970 [Alphaproteobacteria bacterium]